MEPDAPQVKDLTSDDATIWRYMDLPKFVAMLATSGLWFAKAATLRDDPYEGFCKAVCLETPSSDDAPRCITEETTNGKNRISLQQMMSRISQSSAEYFQNARDHLYVNSWCLGESESMAMWQIYGAFGFGVAVKSSVGRFHRSAMFDVDSSHYDFGKVTYHVSLNPHSPSSETCVGRSLCRARSFEVRFSSWAFTSVAAFDTRTNGGRLCIRTTDLTSGVLTSVSIWNN